MTKIFGYTNIGGNDWFKSDAYSDNEIEAIKDPEGGNIVTLPTAIPSPFARIDLVKKAFKNICKGSKLTFYEANGSVIASKEDEKLVSDCLDLAELLFNYDTYRENIKIIVWDKERDLNSLRSSSRKHLAYSDTLSLFLNQDKKSYNFDLLRRIYIIKWNDKVIGATSPATLFFASANDLSHAQIHTTTNDILFDNKYSPLYTRDPEFQKYFYYLFYANPILKERMREFWDYLDKNLKILSNTNPALYTEINRIDSGDFNRIYSELNTGTSNDDIEVLGVSLRKRRSEDIVEYVSKNSDFRIESNKFKGELKPLVLQNDFNKDWTYAKDKWHKVKVPYVDSSSLDRRRLPEINLLYPYLTVSDFLEPYLIRLVYPINKEKYFDGNFSIENGDEGNKGFLLPLKPLFFEFFNSSDLLGAAPGSPKIKMTQSVSNSIKVSLLIPVSKSGEYIAFERIYYQNESGMKPDEAANKGVIVEHQFGVTIYPFIKTNLDDIKPDYRIQLVDRDVVGTQMYADFDLKYYSDESINHVKLKAKKIRSKKIPGDVSTYGTQYYVLTEEFNFIQLSNGIVDGASGIIIPKWPVYQKGSETFSFAIDFGTTNTHIEYKISNDAPKPFDITSEDIQIATLFDTKKTDEDFFGTGANAIRELIEYELMPFNLGNNYGYKFPHRTLISQSAFLDVNTETFALADFNIPFGYEQKYPRKEDKVESNLKWAKKEIGNEKRVRAYFEKIMMLLRNKVLLNRGNLAETKLVWFYPSSMKPARKSSLEHVWNELFHLYFNPNVNPIGIAESLAPFFYYKGTGQLQGGAYKPVVSIDIGGGTSDVVVFQSNKPLLLTSFKFAANSIFGDGFSEYGSAKSNGIVQKYIPHYEKLLSVNKKYALLSVLSKMIERNRSEDINAFFFSLENNSTITDKKLFSYNRNLAGDEDLVIIFTYFYASITYHIASLMRHKGIEKPKHILFSGTGSKILNVVSTDKKVLTQLAKMIFEEVYGDHFDKDGVTIITENEIPKEVTCKGGLMLNAEDMSIDLNSIKSTLTCLESKGINHLKYEDLNDKNKEEITKYVEGFNSFFHDMNKKYSFTDHLNISVKSLEVFEEEVNKHLRDFLEEGIEYNRKIDDANVDYKDIEESLFFYPIIGVINNLSSSLSQITPIN
jgi:hypothetical protein